MTEKHTKFTENQEHKCSNCGDKLGILKHGIPTKHGWKWFCSRKCLREGAVIHEL